MKRISLVCLFTVILSLVVPIIARGGVRFTWTAPTNNTDGTPLTDLAGYKLYKSSTPEIGYSQEGPDIVGTPPPITVDWNPTTPTDGTFYFVVTAFDVSGNESGRSNEVSVKYDNIAPGAPGNLTPTPIVAGVTIIFNQNFVMKGNIKDHKLDFTTVHFLSDGSPHSALPEALRERESSE